MLRKNSEKWAVPGELEYAIQKDAEIEAFLQSYYKDYDSQYVYGYYTVFIWLTEHIKGEYEIRVPDRGIWFDMDVTNDMLLAFLKKELGLAVERKIFDIPAEDIRRNLPEWNENMMDKAALERIMCDHSTWYRTRHILENMEWVNEKTIEGLKDRFQLKGGKFDRFLECFREKLGAGETAATSTELEMQVAQYIEDNWDRCEGSAWLWHRWYGHIKNFQNHYNYYEPWYFPLDMSERDIAGAVREAYENARKRSKRILADKMDYANIGGYGYYAGYRMLNSCECLYQGKAGDMSVRFLFDFEKMEIVTAYPVYREINRNKAYSCEYEKGQDPYYDGEADGERS